MSELSCEWQHSSHTRKWRPMRWQFVSWGDQSEARMSPEPWSWCGYEGNIIVEGNVVIMGNWSSDICPAILYWLNSAWRIGSQSNHNTLQITDYYHPIKTPNVTLHWCWHVFFKHIFCPSVKKRYIYTLSNEVYLCRRGPDFDVTDHFCSNLTFWLRPFRFVFLG